MVNKLHFDNKFKLYILQEGVNIKHSLTAQGGVLTEVPSKTSFPFSPQQNSSTKSEKYTSLILVKAVFQEYMGSVLERKRDNGLSSFEQNNYYFYAKRFSVHIKEVTYYSV